MCTGRPLCKGGNYRNVLRYLTSGKFRCAGELPPTVELRVAAADPYAKGDSATSSYKQCTLEGGARMAVPPFVTTGNSVVVDTRDGTFVRRGSGGS